ncbi:nitrite reductase small subunit NirD [Ferrimonas senticii]|uniref:nitrite reductase small subunit NirD n=1 Tax=Ferrimonas senticii TaxID=394566 RepID=UPI000416F9DB|nr:nitrite reductase small subunit NirD [Ferrimonas senticii]
MNQQQWHRVCQLSDLLPDVGACALIGQQQIALFRLANDRLYAIDNHDPLGGANVLSRGLLAELNGQQTISSPLHRHHYCLDSGQCLQDQAVKLTTYPVKVEDGQVLLAL